MSEAHPPILIETTEKTIKFNRPYNHHHSNSNEDEAY